MEAAHQGELGKTAGLVAEIEARRAELTFDFRHLFHIRLSDIGDAVSWAEAVDLVAELGNHPGSHYWSSVNGFTGPTTLGEIATIFQAQAVLNMFRPKGTDPVRLPSAMREPDATPDVTPEERDELVAYAMATAPFPLDD